MEILIVGNGGREHALAWQAKKSPLVDKVYVAPGNGGTAMELGVKNVPIPANDINALVEFAAKEQISLTIVGPEEPLVMGIVDTFEKEGLYIFGPSKKCAQLEGSKIWMKDFLSRHNIPTAKSKWFYSSEIASIYVRKNATFPIVIKADGLAAGKGVSIVHTEEEAEKVIDDILNNRVFGDAGNRVLIEDYLEGEEASYICMVDGEHILPLVPSQDHKPVGDGDVGPNTGGMGAYTPNPIVDADVEYKILNQIIKPTVQGMIKDGNPYVGFLYAGLKIDSNGNPKVLEFNCRMGDPETQPIIMRMKSDLVDICLAAIKKEFDGIQRITWSEDAAVGIVLASRGYPGNSEQGRSLWVKHGLASVGPLSDTKIFYAGAEMNPVDNQLYTTGGRILCVTALGESVEVAQQKAYRAIREIECEGTFYRKDIANKAIKDAS